MMDLFERVPGNDISPKKRTEGHYAYLQRSDAAVARNIRTLLQEWFNRYAKSGRQDLANRFKSGNDKHYHSAFFELYLHTLICRGGGSVEVHPAVPDGLKLPDFLVSEEHCATWYCEAKVATEVTDEQRGLDANLNYLIEQLDGIESPDFWLNVSFRGALETAPSARRIVADVKSWLTTLSWENPANNGHAWTARHLPTWEHRSRGWALILTAMPRSEASRGKEGQRALGIQSLGGMKPVDTRKFVAKAVKRKATRYGHLGKPFVVAIATTGVSGDQEEVRAALFGSAGRAGAFADFTRVSAVLAVCMLTPSTVAGQEPALYLNPAAAYPYTGALSRFERSPDGQRVPEGKEPIGAFLNLPEGWLWEE